MPTARLSALALALAAAGLASAQDAKDASKQKAAAVASLKKADFAKAVVVETPNFIVAGSLPKEKLEALGAFLEKVAPVARKAAQFEPTEEPWKGKLAVFFLPENRDFKSFVRSGLGKQPEGIYFDLRSDDPFIVDPVEVAAKATEADQFASTAAVVAGAFLKGKAGTVPIPDWLRDGFGRVTAMRAEGLQSKRFTAYRTQARAAIVGPKGAPLADLWGGSKTPTTELLANSFAEYLAYGPVAKEFGKVIYGFRASENGTAPTTPQALEAAGWKDLAMLEAAWKKWVQTAR